MRHSSYALAVECMPGQIGVPCPGDQGVPGNSGRGDEAPDGATEGSLGREPVDLWSRGAAPAGAAEGRRHIEPPSFAPPGLRAYTCPAGVPRACARGYNLSSLRDLRIPGFLGTPGRSRLESIVVGTAGRRQLPSRHPVGRWAKHDAITMQPKADLVASANVAATPQPRRPCGCQQRHEPRAHQRPTGTTPHRQR
jgi:hypothetical protein